MNYGSIGYDSNLRKLTALKTTTIKATDFDVLYQVQASKLNASKVNLANFVKFSDPGTGLGTFNLGSVLNLTSTITYNSPQILTPTFGKPSIAIYQGASVAGSNQIYPVRGGSVTVGRYNVVGGEIDYAHYDGVSDEWRGMIIDTTGTSTQAITFVTQWVYLDYVSGVGA